VEQDAFLEGSFADIERRLLERLLQKYERDPEKAADALAMNRARFYNKLSKYQLIPKNGA
jgi:DNA-binding NtrC family response regulator